MTMTWPAETVEKWPLDRIKPYPRNPRTHPDAQIRLLAELMKRHGVDQPIVVDDDGVILKGHGRRLAAIKAGFSEFPVVVNRGLSEADKIAIRVEDNQVSLLSGWDEDALQVEFADLKLEGYDLPLLGFSDEQMASYGYGVDDGEMPTLSSAGRSEFQQMTFTLHETQVAAVQDAIRKAKAAGPFESTNGNSNGNALARICEAYNGER